MLLPETFSASFEVNIAFAFSLFLSKHGNEYGNRYPSFLQEEQDSEDYGIESFLLKI